MQFCEALHDGKAQARATVTAGGRFGLKAIKCLGLEIWVDALAAIGHPLIGDRTYGSGFLTKAATLPDPARGLAADFPRQALHAWLLGFEHPATHEEMHFESPLPADMRALANALKAL